MAKGQHNRGSGLGDHIYELSKRKDVKNIVEIGTWNGLGTTKCIYDAVIGRSPKYWEVFSLECLLSKHNEAKRNLLPLHNFNLIYGTLVPYEQIKPKIDAEVANDPDLMKKNKWLEEESLVSKNAPLVIDQIPDHIDLLILDGGEYSSSIEFDMLSERSRFIVLDDTADDIDWIPKGHTLKNSLVRKHILSLPEKYRVIDDNLRENNGYLVCERLN